MLWRSDPAPAPRMMMLYNSWDLQRRSTEKRQKKLRKAMGKPYLPQFWPFIRHNWGFLESGMKKTSIDGVLLVRITDMTRAMTVGFDGINLGKV